MKSAASRLSASSTVKKFIQRSLTTGCLVSDEEGNIYLNTDEDRVVVVHAVPGSSMKVGVAYDNEDEQYEIQEGPLEVVLSVGVPTSSETPHSTPSYSYTNGDLVEALGKAITAKADNRNYLRDIIANLHKTSC